LRVRGVSPGIQAVVIISCVAADGNEPKCHPNRLLWAGGKQQAGVVSATFDGGSVLHFRGLSVLAVNGRREARASLDQRQSIRVDPFKKGFEVDEFDPSVVRLCFQVSIRLSVLVHVKSHSGPL